MGRNTGITWTDHTFNGWSGCAKVSAGCKNCYAEREADHRFGRDTWGIKGTRTRTTAKYWRKPLQWNKESWVECIACGWRGSDANIAGCPGCGDSEILLYPTRQRVFANSWSDVFEDRDDLIPLRQEFVELADQTKNLIWLVLTKRPENVIPMLAGTAWEDGLPEHVWIGTSIEDQEVAYRRTRELIKINGRRFLSLEPLLGPVDLKLPQFKFYTGRTVEWVIAGGESGPNARPMHPAWVRSLRDQCSAAGVPFHFKQWGEYVPLDWQISNYVGGRGDLCVWSDGRTATTWSLWDDRDGKAMAKAGAKNAGRILDGKEHNAFPDFGMG